MFYCVCLTAFLIAKIIQDRLEIKAYVGDFRGLALSAETRSSQRKTCHSATSSVINPTQTDFGLNISPLTKRLATKSKIHGKALRQASLGEDGLGM